MRFFCSWTYWCGFHEIWIHSAGVHYFTRWLRGRKVFHQEKEDFPWTVARWISNCTIRFLLACNKHLNSGLCRIGCDKRTTGWTVFNVTENVQSGRSWGRVMCFHLVHGVHGYSKWSWLIAGCICSRSITAGEVDYTTKEHGTPGHVKDSRVGEMLGSQFFDRLEAAVYITSFKPGLGPFTTGLHCPKWTFYIIKLINLGCILS